MSGLGSANSPIVISDDEDVCMLEEPAAASKTASPPQSPLELSPQSPAPSRTQSECPKTIEKPSKGYDMMTRMGYVPGQGLGRELNGIAEPLDVVLKRKRDVGGIGCDDDESTTPTSASSETASDSEQVSGRKGSSAKRRRVVEASGPSRPSSSLGRYELTPSFVPELAQASGQMNPHNLFPTPLCPHACPNPMCVCKLLTLNLATLVQNPAALMSVMSVLNGTSTISSALLPPPPRSYPISMPVPEMDAFTGNMFHNGHVHPFQPEFGSGSFAPRNSVGPSNPFAGGVRSRLGSKQQGHQQGKDMPATPTMPMGPSSVSQGKRSKQAKSPMSPFASASTKPFGPASSSQKPVNIPGDGSVLRQPVTNKISGINTGTAVGPTPSPFGTSTAPPTQAFLPFVAQRKPETRPPPKAGPSSEGYSAFRALVPPSSHVSTAFPVPAAPLSNVPISGPKEPPTQPRKKVKAPDTTIGYYNDVVPAYPGRFDPPKPGEPGHEPDPPRTLVLHMPATLANHHFLAEWLKGLDLGASPTKVVIAQRNMKKASMKALIEFATVDDARKAWRSPRMSGKAKRKVRAAWYVEAEQPVKGQKKQVEKDVQPGPSAEEREVEEKRRQREVVDKRKQRELELEEGELMEEDEPVVDLQAPLPQQGARPHVSVLQREKVHGAARAQHELLTGSWAGGLDNTGSSGSLGVRRGTATGPSHSNPAVLVATNSIPATKANYVLNSRQVQRDFETVTGRAVREGDEPMDLDLKSADGNEFSRNLCDNKEEIERRVPSPPDSIASSAPQSPLVPPIAVAVPDDQMEDMDLQSPASAGDVLQAQRGHMDESKHAVQVVEPRTSDSTPSLRASAPPFQPPSHLLKAPEAAKPSVAPGPGGRFVKSHYANIHAPTPRLAQSLPAPNFTLNFSSPNVPTNRSASNTSTATHSSPSNGVSSPPSDRRAMSQMPLSSPPSEPRAMANAPKGPSFAKRSLIAKHKDLEEQVSKSRAELTKLDKSTGSPEAAAVSSSQAQPMRASSAVPSTVSAAEIAIEEKLRKLVMESKKAKAATKVAVTEPPKQAAVSGQSAPVVVPPMDLSANSSTTSLASTLPYAETTLSADVSAHPLKLTESPQPADRTPFDDLAVSFITETIQTIKSPPADAAPGRDIHRGANSFAQASQFQPVASSTPSMEKMQLAERQKRLEQHIAETRRLMGKLGSARTKMEKDTILRLLRERNRLMEEEMKMLSTSPASLGSSERRNMTSSEQSGANARFIRWPEIAEGAGILVISDDEDEE